MDDIRYNSVDNTLTICLSGRINTNNATHTEVQITTIVSDNPSKSLVLDFDKLEYISSAGLRIILRLRKSIRYLEIVNASPEVYDILEMTGFTEMIPVSKALRSLSIDGCEVLGKGAKGTVYRYDEEMIIKVYNNPESLPDIKNERAMARKAFVLGIPTAISYDVVKVGNSYGSVFELLNAKSYTELIKTDPDNFDTYIKNYAKLLKHIHETRIDINDMPNIKPLIHEWLETDKPYLPAETYEKCNKLINDVLDIGYMLHCDYHTNNVMMEGNETLLIDMDTLSYGHPVFELANIYCTFVGFGELDPSMVENFVGLPYDTTKRIWKTFLPYYLKTENPEKIELVEKKAKLLSYIRFMRHYVRREDPQSEKLQKIISYSKEKIEELSEELDSLMF